MIANNYQGMLYAQELAQQALSPNDVLDLHRILTDETLDHPESAGRMQTPDEVRIGVYGHDGTLLHRPPPANELSDRMKVMCDFANGESHSGFIHPVVRAIIAHFCLAYDHPFEDGNGRTARALFYWSMLRDGYWLTQYLSISSILHKAPVKYARSFQLVETDDNDLTYFIIYQLEVIERAIKSLHEYLARKVAETRDIEVLVHGSPQLNHRQLLIVGDALRDPSEVFTINAQSRRNRVTYQTARTDLLSLEVLGLLTKSRVGNKFVFHSSPQLSEHLRTLGE
jgi:Fic family protein